MIKNASRFQIYWIVSILLLIFLIILIGGITRLTGSGLSMVQWKPLMGVIPPLTESDWIHTFSLYKSFPEYQQITTHFELADFKRIFFWEYLHRMLGRLLGLVLLIPLLYFWIRKRISSYLFKRLLTATFLVSVQGLLGWYMVQSGLVDQPSVSHYRLASHLLLAFTVFQYLWWTLLKCLFPKKPSINTPARLRPYLKIIFTILIFQILYGAFTAGLDAGIGYNTFPKMGTYWLPPTWSELTPFWHNFFENRYLIQFIHRCLGWSLFFSIPLLTLFSTRMPLSRFQSRCLYTACFAVFLQFLLGVLTLLHLVPIHLAISHQIGGLFLLTSWVTVLFSFRKTPYR